MSYIEEIPLDILRTIIEFVLHSQYILPDCENILNCVLVSKMFHKAVVETFTQRDLGYGLRTSCERGLVESVKFLLSRPKVDVNTWNDYPLLISCFEGHTEIVKMLLQHPVNIGAHGYLRCIEENDIWDDMLPAGGAKLELVTTILSASEESESRNSALSIASARGYVEIVSLLLSDERTNPLYDDAQAIYEALDYGRMEVIDLFLRIPKVKACMKDVWPDIIRKAFSYATDLVKLLFKYGVYEKGESAINLFHMLTRNTTSIDAMMLLITDYGIPANMNGNIMLRKCVEHDEYEYIKTLMTYEDVNVTTVLDHYSIDNRGPYTVPNSPIMTVAKKGSAKTMELLITNPAINPTIYNNELIKMAIANENCEVLRILLNDERITSSVSKELLIKTACRSHAYPSLAMLLGLDLTLDNTAFITPEIIEKSGYAEIIRTYSTFVFKCKAHTKRVNRYKKAQILVKRMEKEEEQEQRKKLKEEQKAERDERKRVREEKGRMESSAKKQKKK